MEITSVELVLDTRSLDGRVRAYATVIFDDCFAVRDLKIIEIKGRLILAMPSRKQAMRCPRCRKKNAYDAIYCNTCGIQLPLRDSTNRQKFNQAVAHPINEVAYHELEQAVFRTYRQQLQENSVSRKPTSPSA